jgi:hypothetical protein
VENWAANEAPPRSAGAMLLEAPPRSAGAMLLEAPPRSAGAVLPMEGVAMAKLWMNAVRASLFVGACASAGSACSTELAPDDEVQVTQAALSVCEEAVPDNRFIDGIPSYAQCEGSMTTAIYSNNGVDTATTKVGSDWVRTQYSGGYQCTELAHRYLHFVWDVTWIPNGNAGSWCDSVPPASSGLVQTMAPVHGDLMVLAPGSCGASASTGHVTVVDVVDGSGKLSVVEQNRARRGSYMQSCAKCFLHVVSNDGEPGGMAGSMAPTAGSAAPQAGTGGAAGSVAPTPPTTPPAMQPTPPAPGTAPPAPAAEPPAPVPAQPAPMPAAPAPAPLQPPMQAPPPGLTMPVAAPLPVVQQRREPEADAGCSVAGRLGSAPSAPLGLLFSGAVATLLLRRRRARGACRT